MTDKIEIDRCKSCNKPIDPKNLILQAVTIHIYRCCPSCGYPYDQKTGVGELCVFEKYDKFKNLVG
ncbi:MAG: hypothetical protein ACFFDT_06400 [Candidatus Hodarchaeota archaeon]